MGVRRLRRSRIRTLRLRRSVPPGRPWPWAAAAAAAASPSGLTCPLGSLSVRPSELAIEKALLLRLSGTRVCSDGVDATGLLGEQSSPPPASGTVPRNGESPVGKRDKSVTGEDLSLASDMLRLSVPQALDVAEGIVGDSGL